MLYPMSHKPCDCGKPPDLSEQAFTELLYEAKRLTRAYQGKQGLGTINNKMAYFFKTVRDLCR